MKKTIFLIIGFLSITTFAQKINISGKVSNFNRDRIILKGFNFESKIEFDKKNKTFSKTFKELETGIYALIFKRRPIPIYIESGKDVYIEFDMKDRNSLPKFKKSNTNINMYLSKRKHVFISTLGSANGLFKSEEVDFLNKMHNFKSNMLTLLKESKLPSDYAVYEKRNINYGYVRNIQNYEVFYSILNRKEGFKVSENFPDFYNSINYNRGKDYKLSLDYRMLLRDHFKRLVALEQAKAQDYLEVYVNKVCEEVINEVVKNDLLFEITLNNLVESDNPSKSYATFKANSTNKTNNKKVSKLFKELDKITRGNPSPKFKDYINLEGGKTSLDDVVGKKKFTCIYFWATWCKYCKVELSLVSQLSKKYDMTNIQFLGVNVDKARKLRKWKKMISDYNLVGEHVFSGKMPAKLEFAKQYLVKGVPRFILLDERGKILSFNVPRPDEENNGENFINFMKKEGAIE